MLIQVEPGKPGAEVSKEKLPICQKNKLAYRNVSALRPCFACVTVSIIVRNISIPRLCSGHPFHDNGVAARCTKLAIHSGPWILYKPQCIQMSRTAPWTIVVGKCWKDKSETWMCYERSCATLGGILQHQLIGGRAPRLSWRRCTTCPARTVFCYVFLNPGRPHLENLYILYCAHESLLVWS